MLKIIAETDTEKRLSFAIDCNRGSETYILILTGNFYITSIVTIDDNTAVVIGKPNNMTMLKYLCKICALTKKACPQSP